MVVKSCPFCGSTRVDVITKRKVKHGKQQIRTQSICKRCRARGPATSVLFDLMDDNSEMQERKHALAEAITMGMWNTRINLPKVDKE